jgi:hypothetical protein
MNVRSTKNTRSAGLEMLKGLPGFRGVVPGRVSRDFPASKESVPAFPLRSRSLNVEGDKQAVAINAVLENETRLSQNRKNLGENSDLGKIASCP